MLITNRLRAAARNPLALAFYLPAVLYYSAQGLLLVALPLYANALNLPYTLIGVVLAAEALGTLLGDVPAGVLLHRLGTKRAMLFGFLLSALTVLALAFSPPVVLIILLRLAAGFGKAMFGVAQHTYIASTVPILQRGRALSLLGGIFRIGAFLGPAVAGWLITLADIRAPFVVYAAVSALGALFVVLYMPNVRLEQHNAHASGAHTGGSRQGVLTLLKLNAGIFLTAGIGQLLAQMIRTGRNVVVPLYGDNVLGLDADAIGVVMSLSSGLDMLLFYAAGWLMDHWGRKWAIVPSFTIQTLAMLCLPLTTGFWGLLAVLLLMGFGNGLGAGTMMTVGSDFAPPESRGEFLGIWRLIGDGGFTGAPLLVGAIADAVTLPVAALAMAGAGAAAAAMFAFLVPETLKRGDPAP